MTRSFVDSAVLGMLCCVLLSATAAHGQESVVTVTEPEKCLFLGTPGRLAYLQEDNLVLMANGGGVYAFDVATGAQQWHRYLVSRRGFMGAEFGKHQVLCWSEQGVFLLDAATGKELWWRRNTGCGTICSAHLSPDESRVLAVCGQGIVLYGVADRSQRALPALREFLCWLPDGRTMLFSDISWNRDKSTRKWQTMDIDTGRMTLCREEPGSWYDPAPTCSSLGQLAEWSEDDKGGGTLKTRDARTGTVLHEFSDVGALSQTLYWLRDGKRLFCVTSDRKEGRVIDAETGAVQFALSRDGQRFAASYPFEDRTGTAWVFSRDTANHRYACKMAQDGEPRRVLDGAHLAPSHFWPSRSGPGLLATTNEEEDRLCVYTLYDMNNMGKVAEWCCRLPRPQWGGFTANKALTHVSCACRPKGDDYNHVRNEIFTLNVRDREVPVRTGRGGVRAISPDGKCLVVQTDDKESCLYDAEKDRVLGLYTVEDEGDHTIYMRAVFSDDGKRVAVNNTRIIEVTDLTGDFPRRTMATSLKKDERLWGTDILFSPDGKRLLCGGNNCARLFDADTGVLLHTFEETERFAFPYSEGYGFFGTLFTMAKDWAGMVTDRFKYDNRLDIAFAEGGSRVIASTAGQVIRVWDAESGRLLQTIHTGLPEKRNADGRINNQITLSANGGFAFASNWDNFAPATLWSLADGVPLRRYQLPETSWGYGIPTDDGKAVIVSSNDNLYRWKGLDN